MVEEKYLHEVLNDPEVVAGVKLPAEGPEPGERPEEEEPHAIEYSGVRWATETSKKWCEAFTTPGTPRYEACVKRMLEKLLPMRGKWENKTWAGIKKFIEKGTEAMGSSGHSRYSKEDIDGKLKKIEGMIDNYKKSI